MKKNKVENELCADLLIFKRVDDFKKFENDKIKQGVNKCRKKMVLSYIKNVIFLVIPCIASVLTLVSKIIEWKSPVDASAAIFVLITALISSFSSIVGFIECRETEVKAMKEFEEMKNVIERTRHLLMQGEYQKGVAQIQNYETRFAHALKYSVEFKVLLGYIYADSLHLQSHFHESVSVLNSLDIDNNHLFFLIDRKLLHLHCNKHMGQFKEAWDACCAVYNNVSEDANISSEVNNKFLGIGILLVYQILMGETKATQINPDIELAKKYLRETIIHSKNSSEEYKSRYSPVLECYANYVGVDIDISAQYIEVTDFVVNGTTIRNVPKALCNQIESFEKLKQMQSAYADANADQTKTNSDNGNKKIRLMYNSKFILAELLRTRCNQTTDDLKVALKLYLECYDDALLGHDFNLFSQCCVALELMRISHNIESGHNIDLTSVKIECGNRSMQFNMELCSWALEAIQTTTKDGSFRENLLFKLPMIIL